MEKQLILGLGQGMYKMQCQVRKCWRDEGRPWDVSGTQSSQRPNLEHLEPQNKVVLDYNPKCRMNVPSPY